MAQPLGAVLPWYGGQFFDNNGDPLASGKVFFYSAGSSTKIDTYSDSDLSTANTNPVILDSAGRATIFLSADTYKVVVATSTASDPPVGAQIIRTIDGVAASTSLTNTNIPFTAGESIAAGQWIYLSDGSGSLTAGRWYLTDADTDYSSVLAGQIGISNDTLSAGQDGTALINGRFELLSGTVTTGSIYYLSATAGAVTSTIPTVFQRAVAQADSTTSLILSQWVTDGLAPTFRITSGADSQGAITSGVINIQTGGTYDTGVGGGTFAMNPIDANILNRNFKALRFTMWGSFANNANAKSVTFRINVSGGTNIVASTSQTFQDKRWEIRALIVRRGVSSQDSFGIFIPSAPDATYAIVETHTATTLDETTSWTPAIIATGVANADVVANIFMVEVLN